MYPRSMARPVEWLQRLPAAIDTLQDVTTPVISRAMLQQILRVHRRTAIRLMEKFGGYECGGTFLVDRAKLVDALRAIEASGEYQFEASRRERLGAKLEAMRREAKARSVQIPVTPDVWSREVRDLPPTVTLSRGRLEITCSSAEDLLTQMMELAQAVANDFDAFEERLSGT